MRQRLVIILALIVVVGVLVLLNAASYVKVEPTADSEMSPDRSTLNAGATGTRALYDFLHESGYQVARWRESTTSLLSFTGPKPATIVGECNSTSFVVTTPAIMATLADGSTQWWFAWGYIGGALTLLYYLGVTSQAGRLLVDARRKARLAAQREHLVVEAGAAFEIEFGHIRLNSDFDN